MRGAEAMVERGEGAREVGALIACIVGAALVVAALVLLVLVRMGDLQAGYDLYSLQKRKVELTQEKSALLLELSALKRPDRLARLGGALGLASPRADQVLRLPQSGVVVTAQEGAAP